MKPSHPTVIDVFDHSSGLGGTFTVSILEELPDRSIRVRVWYGRATSAGWEPWPDWDGYQFTTTRDRLQNARRMELVRVAR